MLSERKELYLRLACYSGSYLLSLLIAIITLWNSTDTLTWVTNWCLGVAFGGLGNRLACCVSSKFAKQELTTPVDRV
jgi:hypothetical protein